MAPMKEAIKTAINPPSDMLPIDTLPPITSITMATPMLAPPLMPKTEGPARGLRKAVCNSNPLDDNAAPANMAVNACGSLTEVTI